MNTFTFKLSASSIFLLAALFFFGLWSVIFGSRTLLNEIKLQKSHLYMQAIVTDTRIFPGTRKNPGISYELQYKFKPPFKSEIYSFSDETGRRDLWATLTKAQWNDARYAGTLKIMYSPDNPWLNRPVSKKSDSTDDASYLGIMGIVLLLMVLLCIRKIFIEHKMLIIANVSGQTPPVNLKWHTVKSGK